MIDGGSDAGVGVEIDAVADEIVVDEIVADENVELVSEEYRTAQSSESSPSPAAAAEQTDGEGDI